METLKNGDEFIGNRTKIKVVKNKIAPPFKEAFVDIMFGEGISKIYDLIDVGSDLNVLVKSGSWYSYKDQRLGQGKDNVKKYLAENPVVCKEIEIKVRTIAFGELVDEKTAK